jgi:hypothetical protein
LLEHASILIKERKYDMPTHKLTDLQIAIRIVPKRLRWPESGSTVA